MIFTDICQRKSDIIETLVSIQLVLLYIIQGLYGFYMQGIKFGVRVLLMIATGYITPSFLGPTPAWPNNLLGKGCTIQCRKLEDWRWVLQKNGKAHILRLVQKSGGWNSFAIPEINLQGLKKAILKVLKHKFLNISSLTAIYIQQTKPHQVSVFRQIGCQDWWGP